MPPRMLAAVVTATVLLIASVNGALSVPQSQPAAPYEGPGFIAVTAAAFQPQQDETEYFNRDTTLTTGAGYPPDSHTRAEFTAPLQLPHGATIKMLTIYCKDNSPAGSEGIQLHLLRRNYRAGQGDVVVRMDDPTGTFSARPTARLAVIDNSTYGYYLTLYLQSDTVFYGALVEYAYERGLPLAISAQRMPGR